MIRAWLMLAAIVFVGAGAAWFHPGAGLIAVGALIFLDTWPNRQEPKP